MTLADTGPFQRVTPPVPQISDSAGIENLITIIIGFLTVVGGLLFLIWLIVGAFNWITAEGKPDKLEKARNHIIQALIGLFILVGAYAITALIAAILGLKFLNLSDALDAITNPAGTTTLPIEKP